MKRLVIRADANPRIGTGHVMRCLALAQAWCDAGGAATFVCAELPEALEQRLRGEGMEVVRGTEIVEADWVVLDGYQFTVADQRAVAGRLLVIDDHAHAAEYAADLVLDQNLGASPADYATTARLLLGPRYALLRREFRQGRAHERIIGDGRNVLVTLGGADPDDVTTRVVEALQGMNVDARVVVGASNPHDVPGALRNVTNMPELMAWADVAISAAGSTSWELAFFGLPSLVVALAENQRPVAERLDAAGVARTLGWHAEVTPRSIREALASLLADRDARAEMSQRGRALVDGEGASRVVAEMLAPAFTLRRATGDDCRLLFEWANDPEARASSFSTKPIAWDEHEAWFRARVASPDHRLYIAMDGARPAGYVRYQLDGPRAVVSVSLARAYRGRGYGSRIIAAGSDELFATTGVTRIDAYVKPENVASLRAFRSAGFADAGRDGDAVQLTRYRNTK